MVSCSIYSHSLPSELITFKYSVEVKEVSDPRLETLNLLPSKTATFLKSISQLDIILVTIFLFLIFILSICVLACIVYHRSHRYQQQRNKIKETKGK